MSKNGESSAPAIAPQAGHWSSAHVQQDGEGDGEKHPDAVLALVRHNRLGGVDQPLVMHQHRRYHGKNRRTDHRGVGEPVVVHGLRNLILGSYAQLREKGS